MIDATVTQESTDTTVTKVKSSFSPHGRMGQRYLAAGIHLSMRLWEDEQPGEPKPLTTRDYETVGFVIKGRAELHLEGQKVLLEPGDSWVVPKGASHTYQILEPFTAVEATSPPSIIHGRDDPPRP
ncbi:MAG: cupin domain-containing protein [Thermoguttaceae bacterium]|jgi:quercetin dioxygenase-like cupin family protein